MLFPGGSDGKGSTCSAGDLGLIPGWGRSHRWKSLVGYSPWGRKELDTTERLHFTSLHFLQTVEISKCLWNLLFPTTKGSVACKCGLSLWFLLYWAYLTFETFLVPGKTLPQEIRIRSLGQEDSLGKRMATHSSILAFRISWTEEPGRLHSMGSQRVGHDWVTNTIEFLILTICNFSTSILFLIACNLLLKFYIFKLKS